jgi:hypothetical protein
MERKPREAITTEALDHIDFLSQTGLTSGKIGKILNRSESNIRRYMKAIHAVKNRVPMEKYPGFISVRTVNKWAKMHNLPDLILKTPEAAPAQMAIEGLTINDQYNQTAQQTIETAINMINAIGIQFHELAEYLHENFVKGDK